MALEVAFLLSRPLGTVPTNLSASSPHPSPPLGVEERVPQGRERRQFRGSMRHTLIGRLFFPTGEERWGEGVSLFGNQS